MNVHIWYKWIKKKPVISYLVDKIVSQVARLSAFLAHHVCFFPLKKYLDVYQ